jgi:hypothetical protein
MKKQIVGWAVNLIGTLLVLAVGFGAYSVYLNIEFQKAYQEQVIQAQRENIQAYCETLWQQTHPEVEEKDEQEESK